MRTFKQFIAEEQLTFPYKTPMRSLSLSDSRKLWRKKARDWNKRMKASRETLLKGAST